MKKIKSNSILLIGSVFGFTVVLALLIFVLKFRLNSFTQSNPEDWNTLVSYLNNIINPVLTFINLIIFIKLTKSVQRASENKSWVDRAEILTFDLIDTVTKETSYIAQITRIIIELNLEDQRQFLIKNSVMEKIADYNNLLSENQYKLKIYVTSNIFENCKSRTEFINSFELLIPRVNDFLDIYKSPETDKVMKLAEAFSEIENCAKDIIEKGKKFSDEIYKSI